MGEVTAILILGQHGYGKTLFMTALIKELHELMHKVYVNFQTNKVKNAVYCRVMDARTLLNLEPESLVCFSEAYKFLDKRECLKPENIKTTQALQEIRKGKYTLIMDAKRPYLLDFRGMDMFTEIFMAHGNILSILIKRNRPDHVIDYALRVSKILVIQEQIKNEQDLEHFYIYEKMIYDIQTETAYHTGKMFYMDGKPIYPYYNTDEKIQKDRTLLNFVK